MLAETVYIQHRSILTELSNSVKLGLKSGGGDGGSGGGDGGSGGGDSGSCSLSAEVDLGLPILCQFSSFDIRRTT